MDYHRIYSRLISEARNRPVPIGYTEKHHVFPKSLFPELEHDPANIVTLTAREHFVAHLLLAKMYGGRMIFAAYAMSKNGRYGSREYAWLRQEVSEYLSETRTGPGNPMFGKARSTETREKISAGHRGKLNPNKGRVVSDDSDGRKKPGFNAGSQNSFYGRTHSDETKAKISASKTGAPRKGVPHSAETRRKISEANIGKTHSEETRAKISERLKGVARALMSDETRRKITEANHKRTNSLHMLTVEEKKARKKKLEKERLARVQAAESPEEREARIDRNRAMQRARYAAKKTGRGDPPSP